MIFGEALEFMKAGRRVRRMARKYIVVYADYSRDMKPYLMFESKHYTRMPYLATNADLFADDWEVTDDG